MSKLALVLEGGGMRGAYTAGCLSWFIDNNVEFDSAYGISTGAVYMCSYLIKEKRYLFELSTDYIVDKNLIGIRPLLREGRIVGYDYLFKHILTDVFKFDIDRVNKCLAKAKIGIYDLNEGKTVYKEVQNIDMLDLKAACSLPILGKVVKKDDHLLLDGGITKMIPIEESISDGNTKHFVITTKPADYIRKPSNFFVNWLMRLCYFQYRSIYDDYKVRHLNYNNQMDIIRKLVAEKEAINMYPSESVKVSRLSGDRETLVKLYEMGRQDMENRRQEILEFVGKD